MATIIMVITVPTFMATIIMIITAPIFMATIITIITVPTFMASLSFKPSSSAFCHGVSVDGKMNRIITFIKNVKYNTEILEKYK